MDFLLNHAYSFWVGFAAFLIFFVLFAKFAIKPIVAAIDAREAKMAREMQESEESYKKAKALQQQLDAQLHSAEAKIREMMAEAGRDAEAHKAKLIEGGRAEIDAMRGRAVREIEQARSTALVDLRREVADIATQVAEKIVKTRLDARQADELVAAAVQAYAGAGKRNG